MCAGSRRSSGFWHGGSPTAGSSSVTTTTPSSSPPLEGTTVWDVLLGELPAAVELELDVYWVSVGGRDPATEIRATGDRVRLLHMKDRTAGSEPHDAPAGEGTLAFPEIVDAGRAAGVEWYVAEQDDPRDALADIATAARYLESLTG